MRLELKNLNTRIRQIAYSVNEVGYNKVKSKGHSTLSLFRTGVWCVTRVLSRACIPYLFPYTIIKLSQMCVKFASWSQLTKPSLEETVLLPSVLFTSTMSISCWHLLLWFEIPKLQSWFWNDKIVSQYGCQNQT